MTHQQKLEAVKQKIIEAVPEIMELKFGCEVLITTVEGYGNERDVINQSRKVTAEQSHFENLPKYLIGSHYIERGYLQTDFSRIAGRRGINGVFRLLEILGRPIQLADVLVAIEKAGKGNTYTLTLYMGGLANFIRTIDLKSFDWNLSKPLSDQSPELIDFLFDVLHV